MKKAMAWLPFAAIAIGFIGKMMLKRRDDLINIVIDLDMLK